MTEDETHCLSVYITKGHRLLPSYVVRTRAAKQRDALEEAPKKQLKPIFEGLDALGSTKWRVNKKVLSVVDRIRDTGGRLGSLLDLEEVPFSEVCDTEEQGEECILKQKRRVAKKEYREKKSHQYNTELKLAVAHKMKDEEGFYFPHNLDFRGCAYPIHAHLNHLGFDLCRGLLELSDGKPLGKSGLRWLKIHLANLYGSGVDKLPCDGRVEFIDTHLEDIKDSADNPLEGRRRRWWFDAENPFQCLAVCISLTEALRKPFPEKTISHTPAHQDGSCNGLQHYAAFGRDMLGATAVNLVKIEKPADVYSQIASKVLEIMQQDAEKDPNQNPNATYANFLISQVDRKLVKHTVMTSVYGVTDKPWKVYRRKKRSGMAEETEEN